MWDCKKFLREYANSFPGTTNKRRQLIRQQVEGVIFNVKLQKVSQRVLSRERRAPHHHFLRMSNNLPTLGANKPILWGWRGLFESVL